MRKKILAGFLGIAFLLFFSVIVTMYQLGRLGNATGAMIDQTSENIELSKAMLDAVQEQNTALLEKVVYGHAHYDSLMAAARSRFDKAYAEARLRVSDIDLLDSISAAKSRYEETIGEYAPGETSEEDLAWFVTVYRSRYNEVTDAVKDYMVVEDGRLRQQASELGNRMYRVITPSVLALAVMLMITGMFFLFVDLYFVKPVVRINKSLGGYLKLNLPFSVRMEGRDEVYELREKIEELITMNKSLRNK